MDAGPAERFAGLADPTGASFCVWQANEHRGAQIVNEPNSWVSSELNTRDPKAAMEFYGKLLGWTTGAAEEEGYAMIYRPGYGELLAERDPEIWERLDGIGADRSFADVVAYLVPMSEDGQFPPDAPVHWGITFSVADADAAVARAAELGGNVIVPAFDTDWTRTAVLADPDGAVFTIGQFTPPE